MTIDPRDAVLQSVCPTVAAPRFGALPDMQNGQRVIVASNGLFMQVKLDWLDCILRIADVAPAPPLPYGQLQEHMAFAFGVIPVRLLQAFIEAGRTGLPNEVAGGLIYSRNNGALRLQLFDTLDASPDGITYRMPTLAADESIAIDLHTHGCAPAFWSATDDRDDRGIKVAGVFGHLHQTRPSAAFRLVVNGHYQALRHPWERDQEATVLPQEPLDAGVYGSILKWLRQV